MRTNRRPSGPLASAGMVSLWGASSLIESIQRGTISLASVGSNTATITSVDMSRSVMRLLGVTCSSDGASPTQAYAMLVFTNATTLTASVATTASPTTVVVSYEVVQYAPGVIKSIQRGQTAAAGTTATITAVDTAKSEVDFLGNTDTLATQGEARHARVTLTNATTVGIAFGSPNAQNTSWQVVERF